MSLFFFGKEKRVMEKTSYQDKINYFDAQVYAPWSFQDYGEEEWKKLDRLFRYTGSMETMKVLEPGCGTGRLTEVLSDRVGPQGRVVALDISPKMVEETRKRLAGRQNVEIHLSPLESFPLDRGFFDLILCHQVFPHFEDKEKVLRLMSGSLKQGSKLIVFHFIDISRINDRHRKAGTAVEQDLMPPPEEMEDFFTRAGLKIDLMIDDDLGYFLGSERC
jgi:ubiquinone/menaquinone biosynthesis C-methylase UbiE